MFNLLCTRKFHEEAALFLMEKEPQDRVFECSMMTGCLDECRVMIMKIIRFCKIIWECLSKDSFVFDGTSLTKRKSIRCI